MGASGRVMLSQHAISQYHSHFAGHHGKVEPFWLVGDYHAQGIWTMVRNYAAGMSLYLFASGEKGWVGWGGVAYGGRGAGCGWRGWGSSG